MVKGGNMAEDKKEKKVEALATVVQVTTQTTPAIQLPDGEIADMYEALTIILNKVSRIEKHLVG